MAIFRGPHASLGYDRSGTGDPVVLVHGSLVDRSTWNGVRVGLAQTLEVLTYDRRGYGESRGEPTRRPVREDAEDLADLLAGLDLYPAHVVAHSYAGAVALRLALDRPEMVRSLALHEPPFVGLLEADPATVPEAERLYEETRSIRELAHHGRREEAARAIVNAFSVEDGAWDRLRAPTRSAMVDRVDRWAAEFDDPEATRPDPAAVSELLIPVLLTTGERSPPFLDRIARQLGGRLRNATTQTLPGVSHVPHLTHPDQFIALLHGFLVERNVPST